ncbi:MAG: hypothetical protein JXR83_05935 [Deltaproteobacteria bacterium]|nr:hypothetical protein [Deltaproteobacteria bacterium]
MNALLLLLCMGAVPADTGLVDQPVATREGPTQLTFNIEPKSTEIYVDKRKLGRADRVKAHRVRPGKHEIRLVYKRDETEFDVSVARGQSLEIKYAFEDSGNEMPPPAEEGKKGKAKGKSKEKAKPAPDDDDIGGQSPDDEGKKREPEPEPMPDLDDDIPPDPTP